MALIKWRSCRGWCLSAFLIYIYRYYAGLLFLLSCVALFLLQESMFQWIRNPEGKWIKVSILQEPNYELNISLRPMEHLEEEQHGQSTHWREI